MQTIVAIALLAVQAATGAGTTSPVTDLQTERKRLRAAAIRSELAQARRDRADRKASEPAPVTTGYDWDSVGPGCETLGQPDPWSTNTGNGYSGGLQFHPNTWNAYGGQEFAPYAYQATREQQIIVAERVAFTGYNGTPPQGLGAWPRCHH